MMEMGIPSWPAALPGRKALEISDSSFGVTTLISLRILEKFLRNFSEMLKSIFSLCTGPLPSIKIGGEEGSVHGLSMVGYKRV